jgi:hypothetical protein
MRRNWSERQKEQSGQDPLVCPHCGNYYEYKGEVCLKDGELTVKYAKGKMARECMERMIDHITGVKKTQTREEKRPREIPKPAETVREIHLFAV